MQVAGRHLQPRSEGLRNKLHLAHVPVDPGRNGPRRCQPNVQDHALSPSQTPVDISQHAGLVRETSHFEFYCIRPPLQVAETRLWIPQSARKALHPLIVRPLPTLRVPTRSASTVVTEIVHPCTCLSPFHLP